MVKPINFIIYGDVASGTTTILKNIQTKIQNKPEFLNLKIKVDDDEDLNKDWSKVTKTKPIAPLIIKDYDNTWSKAILPAIHGDGVIIRPRGKQIDASTLKYSAIVTYKKGLDKFVEHTQSIFPDFKESDIDFVFEIQNYKTLHAFNPKKSIDISVPWNPSENITVADQTISGILDIVLTQHPD